MRRPLALLLLASPLLALVQPRPGAAQTMLVDRVVLRINDRIATLSDFERQLAERKQAIASEPGLTDGQRQEALEGAGRDVLADLYQQLLLLSRADQLGAKVSESDVDKAVAQTRERMGIKTDEQMQEALAASGITAEGLRDHLRQNLLVQEVIGREVQSRLKVDEEEQRRYYRDHPGDFTQPAAVRLQDVVVLDQGDAAAVAAHAKQVHDELAAGTAIAEVAKKGAAAGTTTDVVDLGWVNAGDLDPDLESAAWDLPVNGVSEPVHGRGGLHVVKLLERRLAALRPFDDVKEQIVQALQQSRMAKEYQSYLLELEQRSFIALKVPPEAEGFAGLGGAPPTAPGDVIGLGEAPPVASGAAAPADAATPAAPEAPPPPPGEQPLATGAQPPPAPTPPPPGS